MLHSIIYVNKGKLNLRKREVDRKEKRTQRERESKKDKDRHKGERQGGRTRAEGC